jgi:hypothetical protein
MKSSQSISSPQRIKSEKVLAHLQRSPPNSPKRPRQSTTREEEEGYDDDDEEEVGYEESFPLSSSREFDLFNRPTQRARLETSETRNVVTLNGKTPDERLQKSRLTRECLLLIEAEKEKRDAEFPQDIPVLMMPASFRVRKWTRAAVSFQRPGVSINPGESSMVLPTWVPSESSNSMREKSVSSETNNLQKAYKLMLLEKKRQLLSSVSGTTRTRNRQSMNTEKTLQVSQISSSNTQSQQILESEASSVSVPPTKNYKNQQFMKSPIVENIISDEEEYVDKVDVNKEIGKEKKLIKKDDLDDFEEEELGENKKEKEVDELDDDDDDNSNDDNSEDKDDDDDNDEEEEEEKKKKKKK